MALPLPWDIAMSAKLGCANDVNNVPVLFNLFLGRELSLAVEHFMGFKLNLAQLKLDNMYSGIIRSRNLPPFEPFYV